MPSITGTGSSATGSDSGCSAGSSRSAAERGGSQFAFGGRGDIVARALLFGNLRERDILGEAARGEIFGRAGQQRQQRAAAGLGPTRAARKVGGNSGTLERLLQIGRITRALVQQDRDSIEAHAGARLGLDSPRDLDALVHLAGRRDHRNGIVEIALGRRGVGKQMVLQTDQRTVALALRLSARVRGDAERFFKKARGARVAVRNGRENLRRATRERRDELRFERGFDRHIDQQRRQGNETRRRLLARRRGSGLQHRGTVRQFRGAELRVELLEHRGDRGAARAEVKKAAGGNIVVTDFRERARQCAGEARTIEHRREVIELGSRREMMNRARRNRLRGETGRRREALGGHPVGGEQAHQPVERHAMDADHRSARRGEFAHQVVGSLAHRRDDQDFGCGRNRLEPFARGRHPVRGARRTDYFALV